MSRAESPVVLAINRFTSGQVGPEGSPSCRKRRGPSMPAAMDSAHQPRVAAWRKKARKALALPATDTRHKPCVLLLARKVSRSSRETLAKERFLSLSQHKKSSACQLSPRIVAGDKPRSFRR